MLAELKSKTDAARIDFLQSDLALCFTFTELFATEVDAGHIGDAHRTLATAEEGYATISRFLPLVSDQIQRDDIARKLTALGAELHRMKSRLQP
jgi:hypothetical protein